MNNLKDFNIEKEILPLFDYSLNSFTKNKILKIISNPLKSRAEITLQQNIFKGFSENNKVLSDYSYPVLNVNEVHYFLNDEKIENLSEKNLRYRLFASKQEKARYANKFNQLILFFYRLESKYFKKLKLDYFPEDYILNIQKILQILSFFELNKYENIVRENGLKDKHIIDLTEKVDELNRKGLIQHFWNEFFHFEAFLSINNGICKNELTFPSFVDKRIRLDDFYHPLLKKPIKNSFETSSNVIILNGPNMSGKSTFLKAVGLCVYLGHLGVGIPASFGEIPFINYFSIEINRRDDILNGYSHFMSEVINLKSVIKQALTDKSCFAVFDELFSGTNVEDGFEICKTTINGLSKFNNSFFFISTHIQELQSISNDLISSFYIDCKLIENKPTFTYRLKSGWSNVKVGQILFEKEGLNKLLNLR